MKKIFASALFALLGTGAFAQTAPGTVAISGSVGFNTYSNDTNGSSDESKTTDFNVGPSIGYFINEGLELGLNLGYSHSKTDNDRSGDYVGTDYTSNTFRFSPYLKKYFMISDKVAFTGSAYAGYAISKSKRLIVSFSQAQKRREIFLMWELNPVLYFSQPKK